MKLEPTGAPHASGAFKRQLTRFHTWSGLSVGVVVAFLGLTGASFVLRPVLERTFYARLLTVSACRQRLPLDRLAAAARAVHPKGGLESIEVPASATASTAVKFSDDDWVYVDPCTAAILGTQNEYGGFFGFFDGLHRFRFVRNGRQIAGTCNAVFLLLLLVGGVILWWPRGAERLKSAVTFNPKLPGTARTINLHKVLGIYSFLVLFTISATALPLSFVPVRDLIGWAAGSPLVIPPPPRPKAVPGGRRISMQAVWLRSRRAFPDARWLNIHYPRAPNDAIAVTALEKGAPHAEAKSYLYLDPRTGATLRRSPYASSTPRGRKIYLYLLALHSGLVGGLPYQLLLFVAALGLPVMLYSGLSPYLRRKRRERASKPFPVRIARRRDEALGIRSFELVHPRGRRLPAFSAGSHIDVRIRSGLIRQYSLCNSPEERHRYVIGVLRVPQSRGGSQAMHDELEEGTLLRIGGPRNHFPLAPAARRSILLAGGIGVTAILSMAEQLSSGGADFEMHYCTRSREQTPFLERILAAPYADRVRFHFGSGADARRLDMRAVLAGAAPDTHLYACGPKRFMDGVTGTAGQLGWPESHIHREYFGGAGQIREDDAAFDIKLAGSGRMIPVGRRQTALDALLAAGVPVQSSCRQGACGTCMLRVLDGEPDHRDLFLSPEERARRDRFLPCCSRAVGRMLVVDL
ncbi:MAG: 2Fe-2S iron-sulfur cluster binding domain-containing protein [Proteobacteria bacterium]|nr:2Fe-2S iron-sulfur cluster binding domain-containing protein [Pseudomonadota bacterium]